MRGTGAELGREDCFATSLVARATALALVAHAVGCSWLVDPRATQCSSDLTCAAFVADGSEARCVDGYCVLSGGRRSAGGAPGSASAGESSPRSGGAGGGAGRATVAGGERGEAGGRFVGVSGGASPQGGSGGATGSGLGGESAGTAAGRSAGGSEGVAQAPVNTGRGGSGAGGERGTGGRPGGIVGGIFGILGDILVGEKGGKGASEGGACGTATTALGVVALQVPLLVQGQGQRFNAELSPGQPYDLSGAVLTLRAYAPQATGGNLHIFFTSDNLADSEAADVALSQLADGFCEVTVPVPPSDSGIGFDPARTIIIRIEVEAGGAFGVSMRFPVTVVYLDSLASSNKVVEESFDVAPPASTFSLGESRTVANSALIWLASVP